MYFEKLALRYRKIIMKYCKLVDVEEVYTRSCVKKLPLKSSYYKTLPDCETSVNIRLRSRYTGGYNTNADDKCLLCWIKTLEKYDMSIDTTANIPAFLKPKPKTKGQLKFLK
jgi:hypothetical protein